MERSIAVNDWRKRVSAAQLLMYQKRMPFRNSYVAPVDSRMTSLKMLLADFRATDFRNQQSDMFQVSDAVSGGKDDMRVFFAGHASLLTSKCVSIVGTREVSDAGRLRAARLAKELVRHQVVIVSGLAKGVDTAALSAAMDASGQVIAVIGTPLDKAYPAENKGLQQKIYENHLLMTPFGIGEAVFKSNFPKRNRLMAAISDVTVIVEASDTSGTIHQAHECQRLGRPLFIARSVVDDVRLKWPSSFLKGEKTFVLEETSDILRVLENEHVDSMVTNVLPYFG